MINGGLKLLFTDFATDIFYSVLHNCIIFLYQTLMPDTPKEPESPGLDPRRVDKISRWAFPVCFAVFTLAFWTVYGTLSALQ